MNAQMKARFWHTIHQHITVSTQVHLQGIHTLTEVHNKMGFSDKHILTTQLGTVDRVQNKQGR